MALESLHGRVVLPAAVLGIAIAWSAASSPLATIAVSAGVAALLVAALRPDLLLLALVAVLPWEDALAWPTEQINVVKLLGLALFVAWLLRALVRRDRVVLPATLVPATLLVAAVYLALAVSPDPVAGRLDAARYALVVVFFLLVVQLADSQRQLRRIVTVVVLSSAAAAAAGVWEVVARGESRAGGPIGEPNDFAYLLGCLLPLAGYLFSTEPSRRVLWGVCFLVMSAALLATLSRGALVGLVALALWGLFSGRLRIGGVLLGVGALVAVAALAFAVWSPQLKDRLESKERIAAKNVESREALWRGAVLMWADRPLTGVRPGRFGEESTRYVRNNPLVIRNPVAHNTYLQVLAEGGALALAALVVFLVMTWRGLGRSYRDATADGDVDVRRLATALQGALVVALVSGVFLSLQLATPIWFIGALGAALACQSASATIRGAALPAPA